MLGRNINFISFSNSLLPVFIGKLFLVKRIRSVNTMLLFYISQLRFKVRVRVRVMFRVSVMVRLSFRVSVTIRVSVRVRFSV